MLGQGEAQATARIRSFSRRQYDDGMWHPDTAQAAPGPATIPTSPASATIAAATSAALASTDAAQATSMAGLSESVDGLGATSALPDSTTALASSSAVSKAATMAPLPLPTLQLNQAKPPGEGGKSEGGFRITYLIPVFVVLGVLLLLAIFGRIWGRVSYFRDKAIRRRQRYERQLAREQRKDRQKAMDQLRQQWQQDGYGAYHEVEKGGGEQDDHMSDGEGWDSDEEGESKGPISAIGTALGTHLAGKEGQLPPPATRDRFGRHEAAVQSNAWWRVQLRRMTTHSNHSDSSLPDGFRSPHAGCSEGMDHFREPDRGQSARSGFSRRSGFVSGADDDLMDQAMGRRNSQQTQSASSAKTTSTWSRLKMLMRNKSQQSYSTVSGRDDVGCSGPDGVYPSASQAWTSLPLRREDTEEHQAGLARTKSGLLFPRRNDGGNGLGPSQTQQELSYFSSKRKPPQSLAQIVASASRQGLSSIRQVLVGGHGEEEDRYTATSSRRARDARGAHQRLRSEEDWMESGAAPGPYVEIESCSSDMAPYGQQPPWQPTLQGWASSEQVRATSPPRPNLSIDTTVATLSVPTAALCSPTKGQRLERGASSAQLSRESSLSGSVVFQGSAFSTTSKQTASTTSTVVAHDVFGAAVSLPRKACRSTASSSSGDSATTVRRSKTEMQVPLRKAPMLKTVKSVTFASPRTQQAVEEKAEANAAASVAAGPTRSRSGVVKSALKGSTSVTSLREQSQAASIARSPSKAAGRSILSLYTAAVAGPESDSSEDEGVVERSPRLRAATNGSRMAEDELPGLSSGEGSATDSEWDSEAEAEAMQPSSSLLRGHLPNSMGTFIASEHSSMDRRLDAVAQNEEELNRAIEDMMASVSPAQETPDMDVDGHDLGSAQRAKSMPSANNRRLAMAVMCETDTETESQQGTPMSRPQTWQQSNGRWQRLDSPATSSVASPTFASPPASNTPKSRKNGEPTLPLSLRIGSPPSALSPTHRFPRPGASIHARSPPKTSTIAAAAARRADASPTRAVRSPDLFFTSPNLADLLADGGGGGSQSMGSAMHAVNATSPFRRDGASPARTKSTVSTRTDTSSGSDYAATELSAASGYSSTLSHDSTSTTASSPSRRSAISRKPVRGVA